MEIALLPFKTPIVLILLIPIPHSSRNILFIVINFLLFPLSKVKQDKSFDSTWQVYDLLEYQLSCEFCWGLTDKTLLNSTCNKKDWIPRTSQPFQSNGISETLYQTFTTLSGILSLLLSNHIKYLMRRHRLQEGWVAGQSWSVLTWVDH